MATLERRVQVLFDREQYAWIEASARTRGISVGAFIRETMQDAEDRDREEQAAHWQRLWDMADVLPPTGPIDWEAEKDAFDRDILRDDLDPMRRAS